MSENKHYAAAKKLVKAQKFEAALEAFHAALELEPGNPDILNDRGVTYFHMNKLEAALEDLNTAVQIQPDYSYRYSARAYMRDRKGDTEGAVADYRIAVKLDPEDAIAYNNLGLLEEKLGRKQAAEQNFKKADDLADKMDGFSNLAGEINATDTDKSNTASNPAPAPLPEIKPNPDKDIETPGLKAHLREAFQVFRSKENLNDFLSFVRNGFRNKEED